MRLSEFGHEGEPDVGRDHSSAAAQRYSRGRSYDDRGMPSLRWLRHLGVLLAGLGLAMGGASLLALTLKRHRPPQPAAPLASAGGMSQQQLESALRDILHQSAVASNLYPSLAVNAEHETFVRRAQMVLAEYVQSDDFIKAFNSFEIERDDQLSRAEGTFAPSDPPNPTTAK